MTWNKYIIKYIVLISITILVSWSLMVMENGADEVNNTSLETKDAIMLSLEEFKNFFGKLPDRFKLSVNSEEDKIKITLIKLPQGETQTDTHGRDVTIVINKKSGKIVDRLIGQ